MLQFPSTSISAQIRINFCRVLVYLPIIFTQLKFWEILTHSVTEIGNCDASTTIPGCGVIMGVE